jgi:membrane protein
MASEMAFSFVLAFFPFLIFLVSIFGIIGTEHHVNQLLSYFTDIVPINVMMVIKSTLNDIINTPTGGLLTIGFVASMFVSSNAMAIIMKGLNRAYNVEETRPIWYTRGLSFLMMFLNAFVIFLGVNLIIFGKIILKIIINFIHLPISYINFVLFSRWPIVFLALTLMAFLNYYFMPNIRENRRAKFYSAIPGSLFFCFCWLLASWVFSLYVNNFGMYNKVYGTIGAFAVMLIWLYYTSLIILIGGGINSQFYRRLKDKTSFLFEQI